MPPEILDPGLELLRYLSNFRSPFANSFFLAFSAIGSMAGYLLLLAILWWGVSWKLGAKLFAVLVLSVYLNALIKELVAEPRPFDYADFESVTRPGEFSFPSGHAQHAALFWTLLATHFRKRWVTLGAAAMAFLIGFSRMYLGVHFPSDVLAGWTIGILLAVLFLRWNDRFLDWTESLAFEQQLTLALGLPFLLAVLHPARNTALTLGALAGALGGLAIARRQRLYTERDSASRRRWRLFVGLFGLPVLFVALVALSPTGPSRLYYLHLWARSAAMGLWIAYVAPKIASLWARRAASSPSEELRER